MSGTTNYTTELEALVEIVQSMEEQRIYLMNLVEKFHNIDLILQNLFVIVLAVLGIYFIYKVVTSVI